MSWIKSPTKLYIPRCPGVTFDSGNSDYYIGQDSDSGLFAFFISYPLGTFVISDSFVPTMKVNGSAMQPNFHCFVNEFISYSSGGYNLYFSLTHGWVLAPDSVPLGADPVEELITNTNNEQVYVGDAFYKGSLPDVGESVTFTPAGSLKGDATAPSKTISCSFSCWVSPDQFGVYSGINGASGEKIMGLPKFRLSTGEEVVRSLNKVNDHYTYGPISFKNGAWIIGNEGNASGWWVGEEPSIGNSVLFRFEKPAGSDAVGENMSVDFVEYVEGENRQNSLIGEVAIWR